MDKPQIIKDFVFKGRRCVIVLIDKSKFRDLIKTDSFLESDYHNGYIELRYNEIKIIETLHLE